MRHRAAEINPCLPERGPTRPRAGSSRRAARRRARPAAAARVTSSARSPSNLTGERTVRKRPIVGCSVSTNSCRCLRLRIVGHLGGRVHRRVRHVVRLEAPAPFVALAAREDRAEHLDQRPPGSRCAPRASRSAGRRTGSAARSRSPGPARTSPATTCAARSTCRRRTRSTYDCDTLGRLYGPITSPTENRCVKASRLKCAIASSIETSTVRPLPVRLRARTARRGCRRPRRSR